MRFGADTVAILIIGVATLLVAFYAGGWGLVRKGAFEGGKLFVVFIPTFVVAFLIVGLVKVLMDKYMDFEHLGVWLSGSKGILIALLSGILTPVILPFYPLLKELWGHNVGRLAIIMFLVSLSLNWQVMLFRVPLLGWNISLLSFGSSFVGVLSVALLLMLCQHFAR